MTVRAEFDCGDVDAEILGVLGHALALGRALLAQHQLAQVHQRDVDERQDRGDRQANQQRCEQYELKKLHSDAKRT